VSGFVEVREGAKFSAPQLTEVSGSVYVLEGAKFSAPQLRSNGEYLFIGKNKYKYSRIDGVTFYIESKKTTKGIELISGIYDLKLSDSIPVFKNGFIAQKDGFSAHGETVKKAISDLQFKIQSEKLTNSPITMNTVITDNYYRLITGACEMGVKNWRESNGITVEEITVAELLPILEKTNAYGVERFKSLIQD
jgi:hypothetical protein